MSSIAMACLVAAVATACGEDAAGPVANAPAVAAPYDGPLHVAVPAKDRDDPVKDGGAATRALECAGEPYHGGNGADWGAPDGGTSAEDALRLFLEEGIASIPRDGYRVEREESGRVLFSFDAEGLSRAAVIAAKDVPGRQGWAMETYAQCDPSEFPASRDKEIGISVWSDEGGRRMPVSEIRSRKGPDHCDWDSAVFLDVGSKAYYRDPEGALPSEMLHGEYAEDVSMPSGAKDTGYRLGEQELWLAGDGRNAYVRTEGRVERWPGGEPILCK